MATDDDNEEETDNHEDTREAIREALENATDVNAAMAHRFEYHIFHAGNVHRIGRVAIEDVYDLIGEWVGQQVGMTSTAPIHVFMDGKLWSVLELKAIQRGRAVFQETSVMFGLVHEAEVLDDPRVLTWGGQ